MHLPGTHAVHHPWRTEFDALARALGGAMLFGVPLLFTMEMWWIGESISRLQLIAFLLVAFVVNVALAKMSGFRSDADRFVDDVGEAFEAMAVGIVVSIFVLLALGRIDHGSSMTSTVGTVAVQVIPLSLGASVARMVFDPSVGRANDNGSPGGDTAWRELANDVLATGAGAMFFGFALAPTEEIPMLAVSLGPVTIFATIALSLVAGYMIVFASGFDPVHRDRSAGGLFQHPFSETILAFVVSLACAALLLAGFGQITTSDPALGALAQVLVLAVPASIGGAAGRVVL